MLVEHEDRPLLKAYDNFQLDDSFVFSNHLTSVRDDVVDDVDDEDVMEVDDYYPFHSHFHLPYHYHCHFDRDVSILSYLKSIERQNKSLEIFIQVFSLT